ncbi:hypothetical protein FRC10_000484 [Ceratobasidium sp. 414]|nr:hypothetical protein FRC10_000484 [Ceratobasidium sp. 414]
MEEDKLLDLLTNVKNMVKSDPAVARTTLTAHPNLAYALMKEMVALDVVDPDVLTRTLQAATGVQPTPAPAPTPVPAPPVQTYPPPQTSYPPPATPLYLPAPPAPAPSIPPHMYQQSRQQQQNVPTPAPTPPQPAYQSRGPPPPSQIPTQPQPQTLTPTPMGLAPEQQAMIQRLAMLTPDQIAALPPADRAALLELRRQLGLS